MRPKKQLIYTLENGNYVLKQMQPSTLTTSRCRSTISQSSSNFDSDPIQQRQPIPKLNFSKVLKRSVIVDCDNKDNNIDFSKTTNYLPKYFTSRKIAKDDDTMSMKQDSIKGYSPYKQKDAEFQQNEPLKQIFNSEVKKQKKMTVDMEAKTKALKSQLIEKQNEINQLKQKEGSLIKEINQYKKKNEYLININKQLSENIKIITKNTKDTIIKNNFEDQLKEMSNKYSVLLHQHDKIVKYNQSLLTENKNASEIICKLQAINKQLYQQNQQFRQTEANQQGTQKEKVENLKLQVERMNKIIQQLESQIVQKESESYFNELQQLKSQIQKQKLIIAQYETSLKCRPNLLSQLNFESTQSEQGSPSDSEISNLDQIYLDFNNLRTEFETYKTKRDNEVNDLKFTFDQQKLMLVSQNQKFKINQANLIEQIKKLNNSNLQKEKIIQKLSSHTQDNQFKYQIKQKIIQDKQKHLINLMDQNNKEMRLLTNQITQINSIKRQSIDKQQILLKAYDLQIQSYKLQIKELYDNIVDLKTDIKYQNRLEIELKNSHQNVKHLQIKIYKLQNFTHQQQQIIRMKDKQIVSIKNQLMDQIEFNNQVQVTKCMINYIARQFNSFNKINLQNIKSIGFTGFIILVVALANFISVFLM